MCGIAGVFDGHRRGRIEVGLIDRMTDALAHRGPDGRGVHLAEGLGLGHRRLAIIDRSGGAQPLFNEDGTVCVVYNGEIYNFAALAADLRARGHDLASRCDTEVIVHAWEEWGAACVERFQGMFAFALYDTARETLFLARDRLGIKPLHYALAGDGRLYFGSEIKALASAGLTGDTFDPRAIEAYLGLGYVPDPFTVYAGIRKLPPGHTLTWRRGDPTPDPVRYWDIAFRPGAADPQGAGEALGALLEKTVTAHLVSDVPLGGFLSGGMDSSVVVAAMAAAGRGPVTTCTVGFDAAGYDESAAAREVADLFGTDHHAHRAEAESAADPVVIAQVYDEPFADGSAVPTLLLCREMRRHVTVALSGDGGDELFAGYRRHRFHMAEEAVRARLPASLRRGLLGPLAAVYPKMDWAPQVLRAKATLRGLAASGIDAYAASVAISSEDQRRRLYTAGFRRRLDGFRARDVLAEHYDRAGTDDELARIQYTDIKTNLAGGILTKVDRASMAHGLEVRVPLLDHQVAEWAAGLPASQKLNRSRGKLVLHAAARRWLPEAVLDRPKQGFAAPFAAWMRGPLRPAVEAMARDGRILETGYFDAETLRSLTRDHLTGRRDHARLLWALMVLERVAAAEAG